MQIDKLKYDAVVVTRWSKLDERFKAILVALKNAEFEKCVLAF